ncbi:MAG: precorrin-4 C(11)-methyltransferase [Gammaproteobacteria bacterium]|nr:precorrin-4 C(11)-methyltransferase [Gammaproteobacteria bacterium]
MAKVWFVGAGPGDPELITVKGMRLLQTAGAVLYAGSLVSHACTRYAAKEALIADSKGMDLAAICDWLITQAQGNRDVVRLQTGDPSLYGALVEMMQPLEAAGIEIGIVPGVSSAFAAAAAAAESLTLPEVTQTVIFTRVAGRTPMPQGESLAKLAAHGTTLCIFLSITLLAKVRSDLLEAGWSDNAPVVVVYKASWPEEERVVRAPLAEIAAACQAAGVTSQAMILVSPALGARDWPTLQRSKLYDEHFSHRFRRGLYPKSLEMMEGGKVANPHELSKPK